MCWPAPSCWTPLGRVPTSVNQGHKQQVNAITFPADGSFSILDPGQLETFATAEQLKSVKVRGWAWLGACMPLSPHVFASRFLG